MSQNNPKTNKPKTIVVTGANRGLGLEFARQYAADGHRVIACCRDPQSASELNQLAATQSGVEVHQLDVTRLADHERLASELADLPIDVLINNAGVYGPRGEPAFDPWHDVMSVNVMAPFFLTRRLQPNLAAADGSVVANVTSKMGSIEDNSSGGAVIYRSSKAALNAVMKSLAHDLETDDITVLLLHPGWVKTDMGGENALIDTHTSIVGMRNSIDGASLELSGRFLDYDGTEIPW